MSARILRTGAASYDRKVVLTALVFLARNADDFSSYFDVPTDRVVEIGTQVIV